MTASCNRTEEFRAIANRRTFTARPRMTGALTRLYRQAVELPALWAQSAAPRRIVNAAQLAHEALVKQLVAKRRNDSELQRVMAVELERQQQLFIAPKERALPRSFAVLEAQHGLESIERTLGVVRVLIDRQDEHVVRLEEGTLRMERHLEASERTLARTRVRTSVGAAARRLALVGLGALLVFLLLV